MRGRSLKWALLTVALTTGMALGNTLFVWVAQGTDLNWSTDANWNLTGYPKFATDDARIERPPRNRFCPIWETVHLMTNLTIGDLTSTNDAVLDPISGGVLLVEDPLCSTGNVDWSGGKITTTPGNTAKFHASVCP